MHDRHGFGLPCPQPSRPHHAQLTDIIQINLNNVGQLRMVWTRGLGAGQTETVPIVHDGVMYTIAPGGIVQALDATNGDLIWEYKRAMPANVAAQGRSKSL